MKVVDIQDVLKTKKMKDNATATVGEKINQHVLALDNLSKEHEHITPSILQDFLLKEIGEENSTIIYLLSGSDNSSFLATSKVNELVDTLTNKFVPNQFLISHKIILEDNVEYFTNIIFSIDMAEHIEYLHVRMIGIEGPSNDV